jgi:hypothetical protein
MARRASTSGVSGALMIARHCVHEVVPFFAASARCARVTVDGGVTVVNEA